MGSEMCIRDRSAEHLVVRGCLCDKTTFRHHALGWSLFMRCEGGRLTFADCSLECAGLLFLRTTDEPPPEPVPWLPARTPNGFCVNAEDSEVYHWHWGPERERNRANGWIVPHFKDGDDAKRWDSTGSKRFWVNRAQDISWDMGWNRVGLDDPPSSWPTVR